MGQKIYLIFVITEHYKVLFYSKWFTSTIFFGKTSQTWHLWRPHIISKGKVFSSRINENMEQKSDPYSSEKLSIKDFVNKRQSNSDFSWACRLIIRFHALTFLSHSFTSYTTFQVFSDLISGYSLHFLNWYSFVLEAVFATSLLVMLLILMERFNYVMSI